MKIRANPIDIVLKDLPLEGRDFTYSQDTGELNSSLEDLIQSNDFSVKFRLTPVGNAFSLQGDLKTKLDLQCSHCAVDLAFPLTLKLNELIVVAKPMAKGDHLGRANHVHELQNGGPDYLMLESDTFHVADYIHEAIALAEPNRPVCPPENSAECNAALDKIQRDWLSIGANGDKSIRTNPFQILEKMKLKD